MDALCPACGVALVLVTPGVGACPRGHGRALTLEAAAARFPAEAKDAVTHLLRRAPLQHAACPVCQRAMARAPVPLLAPRALFRRSRLRERDVDACPACNVLWLGPEAVACLPDEPSGPD